MDQDAGRRCIYRVIAEEEATNGGGHTQDDGLEPAGRAIDVYLPAALFVSDPAPSAFHMVQLTSCQAP